MKDANERKASLKVFTVEELKQFDGKDGRPLYVHFEGKVYDLSNSNLWIQGIHMSAHRHNENLEVAIRGAPHGEEVLSKFQIIGELKAELPKAPVTPTLIEKPVIEKPVEQPPQPQLMERRDFLKLVAAAGGAVTFAALASSLRPLSFIPKSTAVLAWPRIKIINASQLTVLKPVVFNYPLDNTPNYLVDVGQKAQGGVGPNSSIVAFSQICQHLGCFYGFLQPSSTAGYTPPSCNKSFKAQYPQGYCCCHGSQYDFLEGAKVIGGPAPRPVPQVQLEYTSTGDIYAVSMGPPTIFGHGPPGTTSPSLVLQYDLQGGSIVTG